MCFKDMRLYMKKASLMFSILLVFTLTACSNNQQETDIANKGTSIKLVDLHFDEFTYHINHVSFPSSDEFIHTALAHENRLYYVQIESDLQDNQVLVVTSMNIDGSDIRRIEMQSPGKEVASFNVTNEGGFAFFFFSRAISQQNFDITAYYVEYDSDGNETTRNEFGDFTLIDNPQPNTFVVLSDGRVLAIDAIKNELRELDIKSRNWGVSIPVAESTGRVRSIFPAEANSPYDFIFSDDSYLYGYNIENNEQTKILNWTQLGYANLHSTWVGIFDDGRIFTLTSNRSATNEKVNELYILNPISRNEAPEKTIITMRGVSVTPDLRQAAANFNRQNPNYHIEIYEYLNQADFPAGDLTPDILNAVFGQALLRYQVDIMTGNIPDIIVQPLIEMYDRGFLLDLNPLINADPDISRADFFPNVLSAFERPDGTMPSISNKFFIQTMISRFETMGNIDIWTPEEMFELINHTQGMPLPFGARMLRDNFLDMMVRYINVGFIDMDNYKASFDTDEFINLLNTAKLLPTFSDLPPEMMYGEPEIEVRQMQRGQQLLTMTNISSPGRYQSFYEAFEDMLAIGMPTANGGANIIMPYLQLGIGASTSHPEAAWSFLRSFLLESASELEHAAIMGDVGFPLRIDLFEWLIKDAMTPRTYRNSEGNTVEGPREILMAFDGSAKIELYAMSEEIADNLRAFIESAVPGGDALGDELWDVIQSDLADFYSGVRSAEETARIIQNRAEKWLSEQELLS